MAANIAAERRTARDVEALIHELTVSIARAPVERDQRTSAERERLLDEFWKLRHGTPTRVCVLCGTPLRQTAGGGNHAAGQSYLAL